MPPRDVRTRSELEATPPWLVSICSWNVRTSTINVLTSNELIASRQRRVRASSELKALPPGDIRNIHELEVTPPPLVSTRTMNVRTTTMNVRTRSERLA